VCLLTQVCHLGFAFNPISMFFCRDRAGNCQAVLCEVTNTPWQERHCYAHLIEREKQDFDGGAGRIVSRLTPKEFHVSPFMPMNQQYQWRVNEPANDLRVSIESFDHDQHLFTAGMSLIRRELSSRRSRWIPFRYPLMPQQITALIYWHALRLKMKGCKFYPHPDLLDVEPKSTRLSDLTNSADTNSAKINVRGACETKGVNS
jgi:hypothetical protein